jgi:hypothetical protein
VVTVVLAALVVVGLLRFFDTPPEREKLELRGGERGVADAIRNSSGRTMTVRGYVFEGPGGLGLRLCDGRKPGDPPRCIGPFIDLGGPGVVSLALEEATVERARVRWSDESAALVGVVDGASMVVEQVLR